MKNPYEVLGVSENATDEEIKTAYRNLAKKYHPDKYTNSPLADVAEEKMKEVNTAYDMIKEMRQNGTGSSYGAGGYSQGGSNYYSNGTSSQFSTVRLYIQRNMLDQAEQILNNTPQGSRTAEWYFLMGMCNYRRGWSEQARNNFTTACNMDPNNMEYRAALNNMNGQRSYNYGGYNQTNTGQGQDCTCCDICAGYLCADCLCNCCRVGC